MPKKLIIPIGSKINSLTILKEIEPIYSKKNIPQRRVECLCECGKTKEYYYANIKQGLTTSCGCKRDENVRNASTKHKIENLIGKKYNKLTIIKEGKKVKGKYKKTFTSTRYVLCKCDCGIEKEIDLASILNNNTISCGCYKSERYIDLGYHRDSRPNTEYYWIYIKWSSMMQRCYNSNCKRFNRYGDRGIIVFGLWHNYLEFKKFILEELGERPTKNHSLDRINNDGNYEPSNVRWATKNEQAKNRVKKYTHSPNFKYKVKIQKKQYPLIPIYKNIKYDFLNEYGINFSL